MVLTSDKSESVAAPTESERVWAMLAHLSALSGVVLPLVGNVLGTLAVGMTRHEESAFVAAHVKEALNFNITVTLAAVLCALLALVFIGPVLGTALVIIWLVMTLIAAISAREGSLSRYPFSLSLVN